MIATSEFEKGMVLKVDGQPWQILKFEFYKPGKGGAVVRTDLKNFQTGKIINKTFRSGDKFEELDVDYKNALYLYQDRHNGVFQLEKDKERISFPLETIQDQIPYLKANSEVKIIFLEDKPIGISIVKKVALTVKEAPPAIRGNTATAALKTVVLETGLKVNVPIFIKQDEEILVNTDTGEYAGRAKS